MDANVKNDWIKALRYGEYDQGMGELHNSTNETWCCLGVLADCRGVDPYKVADEDEELLSADFANEVGLTYERQAILARMNDNGLDFDGIAEYIEKNL